jgi:hypothetical protein
LIALLPKADFEGLFVVTPQDQVPHKGLQPRRGGMPGTAATALIALLVFGFPSVVLADANNRTGHHGLFVQRPMSTMLSGRTGAVNDAAKPFNAGEKGSFAELPFVPNAPFYRGRGSGRPKPWIELTEPGASAALV